MDIEDYSKATKILGKIESLENAHNSVKDRHHSGRTFNLHETYFDEAFVDGINSMIDGYIESKVRKLRYEFESL